jgi:hypothetical protein
MAIKNIIAQGIGFSPGSTRYMPTLGYLGSAGADIEQLTLKDTGGATVGITGLDGSSADIGTLTVNGGTTDITYHLTNTGTVTITVDYGELTITGDGSDGDPSAGTDPVTVGDYAPFTVSFDTSVAATGLSVDISFGHDGDDTPWTFTLNFDAVDPPEPGEGNPSAMWLIYED